MRKPLFLVMIACAWAAPGAAQNTLQGLDNFTLERPGPTPTPAPSAMVAPLPAPSPSAAAPVVAPAATAEPRPTATPTARPGPRPSATATPDPAPTPTAAAATPAETVSPTPDGTVVPGPIAGDATAGTSNGWLWWAALAGVLAIGLAAFAWWRRQERGADGADADGQPPEPAPPEPVRAASPPAEPVRAAVPVAPEPSVPPAAPAVPRGLVTSSLKAGGGGLVTSTLKPELRIALAPTRGGVDTLRATLEYELQIGNAGRGAARGVTVETWLTSASHETATDLARLFAAPPGQPMLPPFDLAASAAIDLAGVATTPREALAVISAGERRMFVPILAVRVGFVDGRGSPQGITAAFLVGIEQPGQARLAPLALDRGARMNDRLAARPYDA